MVNYVDRYKPSIYEGNDTMENLYAVEGEEIKNLHTKIKRIINNTFIKTADLNGIQKFEKLLLMKNNADYTLEERRTNVLNKMLFMPPYTRQKLNEILFNIYGEGEYTFEIIPDKFQIIVDINTDNPIVYLQFNKEVRNILPANMDLVFAIQYTYLYLHRRYKQYIKLNTLTYGELSQFSTQGVKE